MADPLAYNKAQRADLDLDLEKGPFESSSDCEAATIVSDPGSGPGSRDGPPSGEKAEEGETDPNIVTWDGPDDPANPMNWTMRKKWSNIAVLSTLTIITPLGSSMFAPGILGILREFGAESSKTTATFLLSIYILGFAFGPLFVAPMSETYGRSLLYNISNVFFAVFSICTALSNSIGMMMAFRFLMGVAGSVPITIGSGSIADIMPVEMRGRAMAAWALGPLLGPAIGPVAGGYLIRASSWRWVYWLIAMLAGVLAVFTFFTLQESYAPVILQRKAAKLRKETGNQALRGQFTDTSISAASRLKLAIIRPIKLLFLVPIITSMASYVAITYGILYLLFSTFSLVFPTHYGFGEGESGLVYIPSAIGMALGIGIFGTLSDKVVGKNLAKGEKHRPEIRLDPWFTVPAGFALPIGLFIYGWTIQYHVHWIVPMIGIVIFAFGLMGIMMCVQNYLLDVYPGHAASVTAALTVLRSLVGALLPLCALDMYATLGMGWGNSLLAFLSLALVPIPLLFFKFGPTLVKKFQVDL
ncbi:MFS general substrate transporter [Trichocladium antarcticum]|uniref:MFS general substrate transporter n=1 Tax=Trichocladium antarcticum TaxID=1450529 RepID=A0AAN6UJ85_9PEZI|nr:MFS general substrate transporter [Trichocladium antarcticum]